MNITDTVEKLPFVGPTYAKRLQKLNIFTIEDLLYHFPFRYDDFSLISPVSNIQAGETVTITGKLMEIKNEYTKSGKKIQKAIAADSTGQIEIIWFNQPYLIRTFIVGETYNFSGKVDWFGRKLVLVSPVFETRTVQSIEHKVQSETGLLHTGRLVPIYNETYGISSKWLRSRIKNALETVGNSLQEFLPDEIIREKNLLSEKEAVFKIHFPRNSEQGQKARYRLSFDELFLVQLSALIRKRQWLQQAKGKKFNPYNEKISQFINLLPFSLTNAQERCVNEILSDLQKETPMNRLLVGDVGSGKTVVAAITALVTSLNGLQTLFMAPTQILANQHYETLKKMFDSLRVEVELVMGSSKVTKFQSDKVSKLQSFKPAKIIVGTHALLFQDYDNVGLVIIDEQHRFGVKQREMLAKKGTMPHILTMTATPIPRTIALTLYSDLDFSVIDEMPAGRATTKTWVVPNEKRKKAYEWIKSKVKGTKEQAFIICPLIEESENLSSIRAAKKEFETLSREIFPDLKLGLLHGKVKNEEKNAILKDFYEGITDILVSTPIVEVGIDIPNATIILIEAADRFGLAQLHQLRGRIGRRELKSYCFLFTENLVAGSIERLKSMETISLGIKLAEIDLKIRGVGEIYGTKQHGFFGLKLASYTDLDLIQKTHQAAQQTIKLYSLKLNASLLSRLEKYKIENVINN